MDWTRWLFLESTGALAAVLGTVLFGLLVYWRRGGSSRPLLVGLAVAGVLLLVQALVATPRERAARMLHAIERELVRGRSDALAAALTADFDMDGLDRAAFLDAVRTVLQEINIRTLDRTRMVVTATERDRFVVEANYLAIVEAGMYSGPTRSRWSLTFARGPSGWGLRGVHCEEIDGHEDPQWMDRRGRIPGN